jgi:hypothetical protein
VEHLFERSGVRAVLLRNPRERAERAGIPQDADVRRIDVLIGGEEYAIAVAARVA